MLNSSVFERRPVTRPVLALVEAQIVNPQKYLGSDVENNPSKAMFRIMVLDLQSGSWTQLSIIPGLSDRAPIYSELVGSGSDLLVIGGCDLVMYRPGCDVYIYSFLSGDWRKGADMPGVKRLFFGCARSDDNRTILVAGGRDKDKKALRFALLYDVEKDKWIQLPDMKSERDPCKAIFHHGKFHVIGGQPTVTAVQHWLGKTAEVFDPLTWEWGPVIKNFLEPSACVAAPDGKLYDCVASHGYDMVVKEGDRWQVIASVPADVGCPHLVGAYGEDKLVVIGRSKDEEAQEVYMLDVKSCTWSEIEVPKGYTPNVQCGCVLDL